MVETSKPTRDATAGCPNLDLLGRPGGRNRLSTPCLVLDLDALDRNIARMASHCRSAGLSLRPHGKSHKCVRIARRQMAAGAVGLCVASVGEAEAFTAGGIEDVLITSPLSTEPKMRRLARLLGRGMKVATVVDSPERAQALAAIARAQGVRAPVLIDLDVSHGRTGVASLEAAVELGRGLAAEANFDLVGLQAYAGRLSHEPSHEARRRGLSGDADTVHRVVDALSTVGVTIERITGGSTGTSLLESDYGTLTEAQFGSYIFMDVEYDEVPLNQANDRPFEPALFVATAIVSRGHAGHATADAGYKHFLAKHAAPRITRGLAAGTRATYGLWSDEHGRVEIAAGGDELVAGRMLECQIPHCDPTVNLYDHFHVVSGEELVDLWPIEARGAY